MCKSRTFALEIAALLMFASTALMSCTSPPSPTAGKARVSSRYDASLPDDVVDASISSARAAVDADAGGAHGMRCPTGATLSSSYARETACVLGDGKRHGPYQLRRDDGSTKLVGQYQHGLADGEWRQIAPDGAALGSYRLIAGSGVEQRWRNDGSLLSDRTLQAGVASGIAHRYAVSGQTIITEHWRNGILHGRREIGDDKNLMRTEERYVDGKLHGRRRVWRNKRLFLEENWKRGVLHGPWKALRSYGRPRADGVYKQGLQHGTWTEYHSNGKVSRRGEFRRGKRQGVWRAYTRSGTLMFEGSYKDDRKDGTWTQFDAKGNVLGSYTLSGGSGVARQWHDNGKLDTETHLKRGRAHGLFRRFYRRTGRRAEQGRYAADKKTGRWRSWSARGKLIIDRHYRRGIAHGGYRRFAEDGTLIEQGQFVDGLAEGPWREFFDDGTKAVEGSYQSGVRVGTWIQWNSDGTVANKHIFAAPKDAPAPTEAAAITEPQQ